MRAARKRYQEAQKKEAEEDLVYYQKMVTGRKGLAFRVFGFISLLVSLVWFVDYTVLQEDTYVFETGHSSLNSREMCFFIKKREYCFLLDDVRRLSLNANATAYFSPVFKDLKFIKTSVVRRKSSKVVPVRSFARSFPYIPLLLCVPFFTFFFRKPVFSFTVAYIFSAGAIGFVLTFRLFSLFF